MGAGQAVQLRLAERRQPSGLFLAQFHRRLIGFLTFVLFSEDQVILSKAPVV